MGWGRSPTVCPPMPKLAVLACQYIAAQAGVRKEKEEKKKSLE